MGSSTEVSAPDVPTGTESDSVNNEKGIAKAEFAENGQVHIEDTVPWDDNATKRLLRKIDGTLIPFLAFLYLLSFLDRTNIGNARLAGLEKSLGLTGIQYNDALGVFFPFYVAAEIPSNMAMKRWRPSMWIPSIMVAWGVCCTLMGIVHNYQGLMAARVFLGIAEGGLFPGITY